MIKLIMCLMRRSDITREEFQDYWLNKHGPFFQSNAGVMRSKKYIQSHTLNSPLNDAFRTSRGMQPEYDGLAEIWFDSEDDLMAAMGSVEMAELGEKLLKDEQNFVDHAKSAAFIVKEQEF